MPNELSEVDAGINDDNRRKSVQSARKLFISLKDYTKKVYGSVHWNAHQIERISRKCFWSGGIMEEMSSDWRYNIYIKNYQNLDPLRISSRQFKILAQLAFYLLGVTDTYRHFSIDSFLKLSDFSLSDFSFSHNYIPSRSSFSFTSSFIIS